MKRTTKTMITAFLAMSMTMAVPTAVFADDQPASDLTADQMQFVTTFEMDQTATVPNKTFTYTITPGTGMNANPTSGTPQILAGPAGATVEDAVFTPESNTTTDGDKKSAKEYVTVDFSNVTFPATGIYRYELKEAVSEKAAGEGITYDVDETTGLRYLDVYVTNGANGLEKTYVLHTESDAVALTDANKNLDDKSEGYVNDYDTSDLTLEKKVAGNQADTSEYFEFTVNFKGEKSVGVYNVDLSNADATAGDHTNPSTIEISSNNGSATFWLKGGQSVKIDGVTWGAGYDVQEDKATLDNEGYAVEAAVTGDTESGDAAIAMDSSYKVADADLEADATVTYTNTKDGVIPTGIMMTVLPGAMIVLVAIAGIVMMMRRMRRKQA